MRNYQKSKLNMYNSVISFCNENTTVISTVPALKTALDSLALTVTALTVSLQQRQRIITGIAESKKQKRETLAELSADLASKLFAYCTATGNRELKKEVDLPKWALMRLRDEELPVASQNIADEATTLLTALTEYNVNADTIKQVTDSIAEFKEIMPRPRNAMGRRTASLASMKKSFESADKLLNDEIDHLMTDFKKSNADFYESYRTIRAIVYPVTTATQIKGRITNKVTGEPVYGALVEIAGRDQSITTGPNGKFVLKPLLPGEYTITISKTGYQPQTKTPLLVKLGQITRADTLLLPTAE